LCTLERVLFLDWNLLKLLIEFVFPDPFTHALVGGMSIKLFIIIVVILLFTKVNYKFFLTFALYGSDFQLNLG
jgi:hypothetical protein